MPSADQTLVNVTVNGQAHKLDASPGRTLLEVLREDLDLTGTRDGCSGAGDCGACAILVDGRLRARLHARTSRTSPARRVTTIEGLATGDTLHRFSRRSSTTTPSSAASARPA